MDRVGNTPPTVCHRFRCLFFDAEWQNLAITGTSEANYVRLTQSADRILAKESRENVDSKLTQKFSEKLIDIFFAVIHSCSAIWRFYFDCYHACAIPARSRCWRDGCLARSRKVAAIIILTFRHNYQAPQSQKVSLH